MQLELSGTQLIFAFSGILLVLVIVIFFVRNQLRKWGQQNLRKKYGRDSVGLKKYPETNAFKYRPMMLGIGFATSLTLMLVTINFTEYEKSLSPPEFDLEVEEEIEVFPERTKKPPPSPPPPPPSEFEEVIDEEVEEDPFEDQTMEEDTGMDDQEVEVSDQPTPPPPPPSSSPEEPPIFKVVEQMPRFPGCEGRATQEEKEQCAQQKLLEYIYDNIKYPAIARKNGVEGNVVLRFLVDKDGSISEPEVVREIGAGCGEEALRVVKSMNDKGIKWIPGKQRGRPVRVQFNLPVRFQLQ